MFRMRISKQIVWKKRSKRTVFGKFVGAKFAYSQTPEGIKIRMSRSCFWCIGMLDRMLYNHYHTRNVDIFNKNNFHNFFFRIM